MTEWRNWAGNVVSRPRAVVTPVDLDELRAAVVDAASRGWTVRVAGSGHSFSPICASDGLIVDLSRFQGIEAIDPETGDATIRAGTKIHDLGEPLFEGGRALANQGDIDLQAIAGAVGTGTHGTGRRYGSFSSQVRAVELLLPSGDLVTIDETSDEIERRAVALSLGMLGIVTKVRLATVPAFKLRERTAPMWFDESLERYAEAEREVRHTEFWWVPPLDQCVLKTLADTDEAPMSSPEEEHPPGTLERYLKPDKVDWSYLVYPSSRTFRFVECEYAVPFDRGPDAFKAIRAMMRARFAEVIWGVEYRTLGGEPHLLSPTQGEDAVTISVHHAATAQWEPFMQCADEVFRAHGGRPHWGKLHWLTRDDADSLYPEINAFRRVRASFDPAGVFLNDHLRELFA